jgi:hypothetical protein
MMMGCHCNEVCAFFVTNLLGIFALYTHIHTTNVLLFSFL